MTAAWLWLLACSDLTPNERVLGDEVKAQIVDGPAGFGSSLAGEERAWWSAQPLHVSGFEPHSVSVSWGSVKRVGSASGVPWVWLEDGGVFRLDDGTQLGHEERASSVAVCPDMTVLRTLAKGESVACGEPGVIRTVCEAGDCSVWVNDREVDDGVSDGGAVGWWQDVACWGDPELAIETGPGSVHCEDGRSIRGEAGDHLGLSMGAGRAAGRFNRHIVPPRLRVVPLDGGDVWAVDRAAENSRVSLAAGDGLTLVGVPQFRQAGTFGRIFAVEAP